MRVHYYSQDWDGDCNLGDWLTIPIVRALGGCPISAPTGDHSQPVLFGIGSILDHNHYAIPAPRIVVWGSGIMQRGRNHTRDPRLEFRAVRGPLTREEFGLPRSIPMGDPAILLPELITLPEPPQSGEVLYVGHCGNPCTTPDGFDAGVTMRVQIEDTLLLVSRIAHARFVASESLHGCILACAYGVPWAPCTPDPTRMMCDKWTGWSTYLGIDSPMAFQPATPKAARDWWDHTGRHGKLRDTRPLVDAFPHELLP